jgi:hypothetical protein
MKAAVRQIYSLDLDLESFSPSNSDAFGLWLRIIVGPADDDLGEESFDLLVCSPSWLDQEARSKGPIIGRHHLIVANYDLDQIFSYLKDYISSLEEADWATLAGKISRIAYWEFEDYRE